MRTAKTLIRLGGAQADLSLRWAHIHFVRFVMSWLICCKLMTLVTVLNMGHLPFYFKMYVITVAVLAILGSWGNSP